MARLGVSAHSDLENIPKVQKWLKIDVWKLSQVTFPNWILRHFWTFQNSILKIHLWEEFSQVTFDPLPDIEIPIKILSKTKLFRPNPATP